MTKHMGKKGIVGEVEKSGWLDHILRTGIIHIISVIVLIIIQRKYSIISLNLPS